MRFVLVFCLICIVILTAGAQSPACSTAVPFCFDSVYTYTRGTGGKAETGPDYSCLGTEKNPSWYYMQIKNSGPITFEISTLQANDTRFILWGPFAYPFSNCGANLTAAKTIGCGKSTATIPNAIADEYYILLLTNNSGNASGITFTQTSGTGSSNCDILCNLTAITATATACQSGVNLGRYTVTGIITTQSPPSSGTLKISSSCGTDTTYYPPFSTSLNYTLPYTGGHGDTCTITATYSANSMCTKSATVITPKCCTISATTSSFTVCESQSLSLLSSGTAGSNYFWTGPSGYTSNQQNPTISNILTTQAGTYHVYLVSGGCTTQAVNVNVTVNPKPIQKNIIHR